MTSALQGDAGPPLLTIEGLSAHYGQFRALTGIDLTVREGETVAIIGANGAGKSTLLRTLVGLHRPTSGRVLFDGADVSGLSTGQRLGAGIALVPEGRRLFPSLTVEENLLVGAHRARKGDFTVERVYDLFEWMRARRRQRAAQLSGGEQQAVALGRALVSNPRLLLLDELSLGLAPVVVQRIYGLLPELLANGLTVLLVEQDVSQAMRVADRVTCLLEGRITLSGASAEFTKQEIEAAYFGAGFDSSDGTAISEAPA